MMSPRRSGKSKKSKELALIAIKELDTDRLQPTIIALRVGKHPDKEELIAACEARLNKPLPQTAVIPPADLSDAAGAK